MDRLRLLLVGAFAFATAGLLAAQPAHAAPANDNFAAAVPIAAAQYTATVGTTTATLQAGEPQRCPVSVGKTVWYAFTAPAAGTYIIDTYGSDYDTLLTAFTGSTLSTLNAIACSDDTLSRNQSRLELQATAGVTYSLQVGGFNSASGAMRINVAPAPPPPPNDAFEEPMAVGALPFSDIAFNYAATTQGGESRSSCSDSDNTVWYRFIAPATGQYQVDTMGSDYDTVLAVYTGTSLNSTNEIACHDDVISVQVETSRIIVTLSAGVEYRIQVGGFSAAIAGLGTDYGRLAFTIGQPISGDTDGDGCSDSSEVAGDPAFGGGRSIYDRWDLFDVTGDGAVDLADTLYVLQHFGRAPGMGGYDATLDRYQPDPDLPYRTSAATASNAGIDAADALVNLASFGHRCGVEQCIDTDGDGQCNVGDPDDDNDHCPDARETGSDPVFGGSRDPLNPWDFFDTTGDGAIGLEDATDILQYWGDPGTSPAANLRDRYVPDTSKPWRTAAANDGIDGTDVLAALGSFGHRCL